MRRLAAILLAPLAFGLPVSADPCGLVPPIEVRDNPDILTRVGDQITYVFFKDGIEDIVLRPAFKGRVDQFGMLIPFPTPPAIRKVADDIFGQVAKAVDPPKVTIDLYPPPPRAALAFSARSSGGDGGLMFKKDEVRVLKEEAVGMYQVAVLEAGSAKALKTWMTTHGYVYPEGMENVVNDYVAKRWCFVAVKARVGRKKGVEPRPGMKRATPDLPENAEFSGAVQAMGFRFRVDTPVVPMRLSAYNPGRLYNIVYALCEKGVRIPEIGDELERRTIPGGILVKNLTEELPATVFYPDEKGRRVKKELARGETFVLPDHRWLRKDAMGDRRDPSKVNGKARDLFAADLLAAREGRLAHAFEEKAKELLNVGEELGLRGPAVDALIEEKVHELRAKAVGGALEDLAGMTLTVIKGDFPREVLREKDLTLAAAP